MNLALPKAARQASVKAANTAPLGGGDGGFH
jgi:hypothetical protein